MIDNDRLEKELKSLSGWAKFRTFTILKMPSAAFVGLRFVGADSNSCTTSIPGGWRSQNPFKTMYWAAQGMAAELATGAVPFAISRSCEQGLRMFVVGTEATFVKRAKGRIHFTCDDIAAARTAIEAALNSNEATECDMRAVGIDPSGDTVSEWVFKWNFKAR